MEFWFYFGTWRQFAHIQPVSWMGGAYLAVMTIGMSVVASGIGPSSSESLSALSSESLSAAPGVAVASSLLSSSWDSALALFARGAGGRLFLFLCRAGAFVGCGIAGVLVLSWEGGLAGGDLLVLSGVQALALHLRVCWCPPPGCQSGPEEPRGVAGEGGEDGRVFLYLFDIFNIS